MVSIYCDGDKSPVPEKLQRLRTIARREGKQLLIMGDLNSHSEAGWNSKKTDARGRAWEKFIFDKGLRVLNRGDQFTFIAPTGQSIVDVSMATPGIADLVQHWAIRDHVPSSDHVLAEFILLSDNCWTTRQFGWNLHRWKKEEFMEIMEEKESQVSGPFWDLNDLNKEAFSIRDGMIHSMDQTAPESGTITKINPIEWWTPRLTKLESKLKIIRHYVRKWTYRRKKKDLPDNPHNKMKYTFEDLKTARRSFKKACRKAKRIYWRELVGNINDTVVTAQFSKRLNRENNAEIGLFTKANGQRCTTDETLDLLKDTHFPGNTLEKPPPVKLDTKRLTLDLLKRPSSHLRG